MKIVVAGGTGFLGAPLCGSWADEGHEVLVLTRSLAAGRSQHEPGTGVPGVTRVGWTPSSPDAQLTSIVDGATAVVNIAGESIDAKRWTAARKQAIRDSRLVATRALAEAIGACATPPQSFISGSAVGYYGDRGSELLAEDAGPGADFLARVCVEWEAQANAVDRGGVRVAVIRTGIVLERSGGALPRMMRPFRYFVGGALASGRQYLSWIHRLDWIEMVRWAIESPLAVGAINATAPHPVTNREFTHALARAMHRPAIAPAVPRFVLRLAVGEIADALVTGQRVVPGKALAAGFHFRYPEIDIALRGILET
ncbi:MAG TPA: TIGR01777 family oxidoreductase [Vicinamibacterales bacterium]|nr:TIGR01777 family oxidoreductase [Vicinamibacterales bacterium]